jgi:hypothetical protein
MQHDPRAKLTVQQNEILNQFIQELGELTPKQKEFCDISCCLRYLRARDWDIKKSLKLLRGSFEWRANYKPDRIDPRELDEEASSGKVYTSGFDNLGRPVVYMIPAQNISNNFEKGLKLLVYMMEKAINSMPEGVEQLVWFIDFHGFSRQNMNMVPISVAKEAISILSDQYPERLGVCYFVDTPMVFTLFYKAISPFINPVTKNKIKFVNGDVTEKRKILSQHFNMKDLHVRYGGESEAKYEHATYWKAEIERSSKQLDQQQTEN